MPPAPPAFSQAGTGFDGRGVLVEVVAGEGGDDAKVFALELFRAYLACLDRHGIAAEIEDDRPGKYSLTSEDERAASLLEAEHGTHCIQRVPGNDRHGRRQTSYVSVFVAPLQTHGFELREADLEESFQRGRGPGGQHQNKVASAVRLRHRPSGLEVFINGRKQGANRRTARLCLAAKLKRHCAELAADSRGGQGGASRGGKIRTYNLLENRIVDHRTGARCHRPELVLIQGRFELLR